MIEIHGAGGGSKPKKQKPPYEAPNTLRSAAKGQILDLLAYGPIKGFVDGLKSVLLDDTPVENPDGSLNFDGVTIEPRWGDPAQDIISGFKSVSNPREINAEVTYDTPIVRTLLNNEADAIIVTVRLPALVRSNSETGDTLPHQLPFAVHVQTGAGVWNTGVADVIRGKNTSPYERSYRINLSGGGPYSIKVLRGNRESTTQEIRDQLFWSYLTEVIDVRHNYPSCALVGISVDAKLFGNSLPSRKYLLDLSIVKVPSNYNPETRAYTGIWDGTFKEEWTDNPAWCFYDLATHPIIGAGIEEVNKWALYEIGKYCDQLVDDGYGGMEPRFTCNTVFSAPEDAITALNTLASVFRGMMYWGAGAVEPVADMPGPIRRVFSPSEVIDGEFSYSGTALKERHSVAVVMWNDPEDGYVSKPEMIEDAEQIELLGWRELRITAVACTSRGQARRVGLWALYTEKKETQAVTFSVPVKHFDLRPGEFIAVNDPYRAGARLSGKVVSLVGNILTVDMAPVEAGPGWSVTIEDSSGGLVQVAVTSVTGNDIQLATIPAQEILTGTNFALSSSTVGAKTFRVTAVSEQAGSIYSVTATEHHQSKYQEVEDGLIMPEVPSTLVPTGRLSSPKNLTAETYTYLAGGSTHQALTIGWTAPEDARVGRFILEVKGPDDMAFRTVYAEDGVSFDLLDVTAGTWSIRVRAASQEWGNSAWIEIQKAVANLLEPLPPSSLFFTATANSITVQPVHEGFAPEFEFWRSSNALSEADIISNASYLGTGPFYVDMPLTFDTVYYYYVRGVNAYGQSSWLAGNFSTTDNIDEILGIILDEQQSTPLGQWFQTEIAKISGVGPGSVNERIDVVGDAVTGLEGAQATLEDEVNSLQAAMDSFLSADTWDINLPYLEGAVVKWDNILYTAKQDVPAGTPTTDLAYWKEVGSFVELNAAITALALRVETTETQVIELDGYITPMVSQITSLMARWSEQDADEDGYLDYALRQWDAQAEIAEEVTVRANAVEALSQRVTTVSSSLGNMGSSITALEQSLTTDIDALALRVTNLQATVGDDVVAAIQTEQQARVDADQALASDMTLLRATIDTDVAASILSESTVRASADEALSIRVDSVVASVGTTQASVTSESVARVNADEALGQRIDTTQSSVGAVHAVVASEAYTRATADHALSLRLDTTESSVGAAHTAITSEISARTSATEALGQRIDNIQVDLGPTHAMINSVATASANADIALGQRIDTVQAGVDNNYASVQTVQQAQADTDGELSAMWGVKLQVNTAGQYVMAGIGLGIDNVGGVLQSNFIVQADKFSVINGLDGAQSIPFTIVDGNVIINSAYIGDATIEMAKIGGDLYSSNYVLNSLGWKLHRNGLFEINSSLPGGGRIQLDNDGLRVYDALGNIRVKVGNLS